MLTLFTAPNGAGKTQRIVDDLLNLRLHEEKIMAQPDYSPEKYPLVPRLIFTNIAEIDASLNCVDLVSLGGVKNWQNAPDGALFIVDEAQFEFPQRNSSQRPPDHIEQLAVHRHRGFDFWLITQSPKIIDPFIRPLISMHYHGYRPFGMEQTSWLEYSYCEESPKLNVKPIAKKRKFNKDIYKFYKSSTAHTGKANPPKKLIYIAIGSVCALIFAVCFGGYKIYGFWYAQKHPAVVAASSQLPPSVGLKSSVPVSASNASPTLLTPKNFKQYDLQSDDDYPAELPKLATIAGSVTYDGIQRYLLCLDLSVQPAANPPVSAPKNGAGDAVSSVSAGVSDSVAKSAQQQPTQAPPQQRVCSKVVPMDSLYSFKYDTKRRVVLIFSTKFSNAPEFFVSDPLFLADLDEKNLLFPDKLVIWSQVNRSQTEASVKRAAGGRRTI